MTGDEELGPKDRPGGLWVRSKAADHRDRTADDRDLAADDRDRISEAYDAASQLRDERAEDRDRRAEAREVEAERFDIAASTDRAGAWRDRRGAASDRVHAADDRQAASTDRLLSGRERATSSIDELTGAYRRDAGMVELARETARALRTGKPLVLAFVDVDGLKVVNDTLGHAAGDQLLYRVVATMRAHFRGYDLIVRFGGDEFVCALLEVTHEQAVKRFAEINTDLAEAPAASITAGLALLDNGDSLDTLIDRADAALRVERKGRSSGRDWA